MRKLRLIVAFAVPILTGAFVAAGLGFTGRASAGFEVWAIDQSNTNGTTSGGTLYVYRGAQLVGGDPAPPEKTDLGAAAKTLCETQTGTAPVRPHMLFFNARNTHAVIAFVASGHVLFLDRGTRAPLTCIDVGVQAHAAVPSPDGKYVIVANQNGKLLQRISTDYATNTFTLDASATLNLATCTTPSGAPCESADVRPDNAPICPLVESTSRFTFVTLRGGGLLVVDSTKSPMSVVAEYDKQTVHGNGCGGVQANGKMYVTSGGGTATNLSEFDVYAFNVRSFSTSPSPPNTPAPKLVVSQDEREHADAHGVTLTKQGRYLWVVDRMDNRIVVIETATDRLVGEFSLAGPLSSDPAPDLLDIGPMGNRVYASFRGALPLSGDPHASTGSTPGVGVIKVEQGGRTGVLQSIARISNVDGTGIDRADVHALRVTSQ